MNGGESKEEIRDDPAADDRHLAEVVTAIGSGLISVRPDFTVRWCNPAALDLVPEVVPGANLYETFSRFTSVEKLDRLILRHEMITCRCSKDRPETAWMNTGQKLTDGGFVLMVWRSAWTDDLNQRRVAFTMAASHELRTPLTVLLGFAELLLLDREGLSPSQIETATIIAQTSRHLRALVDDIFDLTKNSFGELQLKLEWGPIEPIIHSVVDSFRPQLQERNQSLSLRFEPNLPPLEVDRERVRQITTNLIGNASVHNAAGTAIRVGLLKADHGIELTVADEGSGIGFEDPEDALHGFQRGDNAGNDDGVGAGIGLTIAKRLIELHRGQLNLESAPDAGTTVTVWLPLDRSTALTEGESGPA